ncbi:hypothetical protein [Paraburkholderia sp. BL10I2N1]|uniref:hypothetical protein n=1 Tax=Paraburkholderia sp. BL10I2N1 TaxID=1938796 RepID=UPI001AADBFC7|nr:hypothetical protein [Paraburkholderia sp. BL10I2N1]
MIVDAYLSDFLPFVASSVRQMSVSSQRATTSLAKGGMPSRAEVSDAAIGSRAECVMLNKGPYIPETLAILMNVLVRIEEHQHKKTARLRKLRVAGIGS